MNEHISSDRLIAHHRTREDYVQSPLDTIQFAYGDHRYVKFTYELLNESDILQQKILKQMIQDFSLCENVDNCLKSSDMLSVLLKKIQNKNQQIRKLSTTIIKKICASPLGRHTIIDRKCIQDYEDLINDDVVVIRSEAYDGLIQFVEFTEGINCILESKKILSRLVDKLIEEKVPQILLKTITLLCILMQGEDGTPKALKTEIIQRLMSLISHQSAQIQYRVCMTLANISFNYDGKQAIVAKKHIKKISEYIADKNANVRQAACLLLCSLSQLNQGKIQILQFCKEEDIQKLLHDESATVLNCVQLIANLGQNPKGREAFMKLIPKLDSLKNIQRKYIDETLQVLKWTP